MKKKILLVILCLVFLYCIGGVVYSIFINQKGYNKSNTKSSVVTIDKYSYEMISEKYTKLFQHEFMDMKQNLESEKVDYSEYAKSIAKLYVIDFYTLDNKLNKYDIGALQFVYPFARENFKLKASETLYKYIIDNTDGKRDQNLPIVKNITISNVLNNFYQIEDKEYEAYEVILNWDFEKDLGYDTNAKLVIVNIDNTLYVVSEERIESN